MTRVLVTMVEENFRFRSNLLLLKACAFTCVLLVVLFLAYGPALAADSSIIAPGAKLEKLGEGYAFTEGPAVDRDGNVFFSDIPNNRIVKWSATDGKFSDWLKPSGYANGTYFDRSGNLLAASEQRGELWSIAPDKKVTVLATNFGGKLFNGPNDLWIHPDGGVYFTDPLYFQPFRDYDSKKMMDGQHVYFLSPDHNTVTGVTTDLTAPNGIIGTPDGKVLYVGDLGGGKCWAYDIQTDGKLANKRLFYNSSSDGMTIDNEGNIYLTGSGVEVIDKTGKQIEHIAVPREVTTNVTFGGKDRDLLFITAGGSAYGLKTRVKGARQEAN